MTCPSNLQGAEQLGTYAVMIVGTTNSGVSVQIEVSQNKFTGGGTYSAAQADFLEGTIGGNGYIPDPNNTTASMTIVNDGNSGSLSNLTALPVANPAGTAVSLSGTFTCGSNSSGG
ncbi:MAG TPA: hypothetical protein VND96_17685 [Candidatus Micrarchaeaceae archaeon]|nr:hypothetical protein [Candidatus Micrarchaeaceae archaeon]